MKKIIISLAAIAGLLSCGSDQKPELGTESVYAYHDFAQTKLKSIGNYRPGAEKQMKHATAGLQMLETYNSSDLRDALRDSGLDTIASRLYRYNTLDGNGAIPPAIFSFEEQGMLQFQRYLSANPDVLRFFPTDMKFMWSAKGEEDSYFERKVQVYKLYATRNSGLTIDYRDVAECSLGENQGLITVLVSMTAEGTERWAQMTSDNMMRCIAITVDGAVYSAPMVRGAITGGNTEISGNFTEQEATDLAYAINAYVLNGEWRAYHENGKLKEIRQYEKGEQVGEWSTYDQNGKLIKKRGSK